MNWIDYIFLVIIIFFSLKGFLSGFFKGLSGIISMIVGIILANFYYKALASFLINQWNLDDKIMNLIKTKFISGNTTGEQNIIQNQLWDTGLSNLELLVDTILNSACFIIILLVVYICLKLILNFISSIINGTIFVPFDKLGGILLGMFKGVIIVSLIIFLLLFILEPVSGLNLKGQGLLSNTINNSFIISSLIKIIKIYNLPLSL
ncbi:MAG: CvpA family protein [Clostridiales bacterium]|nr:CvpA family protein [Clostridiales bacterium]MCF8022487.1 CvpA family protein [Clostridiales bacterium]